MTTGRDDDLAGWALGLAREKLAAQVPRRWLHTEAAVVKARSLAPIVGPDAEVLVAAVALHDIGFSPDLELPDRSDFPLYDAARYLMSIDAPNRVVCLVANHVKGQYEGALRGYGHDMARFEIESSLVSDGQWYSCLTVGPDGQDVDFDQRVREWRVRYADDEVLQSFTDQALPELDAAVRRVQRMLVPTAVPGKDD